MTITHSRRVIVFSDSRAGRDSSGRPSAMTPLLEGSNWRRGLTEVEDCELALRVHPAAGSASLPITGTVHALPYYVGGLRTMLNTPPTLLRVLALTRGSAAVVNRLPGVVGLMACFAATLLRKPLATEVVGDIEEVMASTSRNLARRRLAALAREITKAAVRRADVVRYVTLSTLQSKYPVRPGATSIGFSAVRLDGWDRPRTVAESEKPSVLAVGTHEQLYKGHDTLIRSFAIVRESVPDAELILVGDGRRQGELLALCDELGVREAVNFLGYVSEVETLIDLIDSSWVFAMPSRTEGLPRSLVEAMTRGRACVGTRVGGIPELLESDNIVTVDDVQDLARVLRALLEDPPRRTTVGLANKSRARNYAPESLAERREEWNTSVARLG